MYKKLVCIYQAFANLYFGIALIFSIFGEKNALVLWRTATHRIKTERNIEKLHKKVVKRVKNIDEAYNDMEAVSFIRRWKIKSANISFFFINTLSGRFRLL